jgi:hypothetical protein
MRETLIVIGFFVLAFALRSARRNLLRKVGALVFLGASFCLFYFISGSRLIGLLGVLLWFFLPWVELLTRVRRMRLLLAEKVPAVQPTRPRGAARRRPAPGVRRPVGTRLTVARSSRTLGHAEPVMR